MPSISRRLALLPLLAAVLVMVAVTAVGSAGPVKTCTIKGTKKADVLKGTARADVICGLGGNDKLYGLAGADTLIGGAGNDVLVGGAGADVMNGGTGADAFFAGAGGIDRLSGGPGIDRGVADPKDIVAGIENLKLTGPALLAYSFSGAEFTVGSKQFTEQLILGHITKQALEFTGAKINNQVGLGGTSVNRSALTSGKIDMYWEYTGTGWIVHLNRTQPINNATQQWEAVRSADVANGVTWLAPAPFDNTYAFAVRSEAAAGLRVTKISDFATLIRTRPRDATVCVNTEFATRDDGLPGVEKHYGFKFPSDNVVKLDTGLIYKAVDDGKICNFGITFATDGRIEGLGLTVIADDKQFFPIYNPALNVRSAVFQKYPRLAPMFKAIALELTNARMQRMNADVDIRGKFPEEVARTFLAARGFTKTRK